MNVMPKQQQQKSCPTAANCPTAAKIFINETKKK